MQGNMGPHAKYDVEFKEGQLVIECDFSEGASTAGIVLKIDAKQVLDAIGKLGTVEQKIVDLVEAAILPKPVAAPSA